MSALLGYIYVRVLQLYLIRLVLEVYLQSWLLSWQQVKTLSILVRPRSAIEDVITTANIAVCLKMQRYATSAFTLTS
jgi:hypothetical protein